MTDLVDDELVVAGRRLRLLRPRDPEALLDEHAFEQDEFLPYWAELWPSAHALAEVVADRDLRGVRVLELGCGLGLPSLAAALRGADVLATDWAPRAVQALRRNAQRNGIALRAEVWRWDAPPPAPPWPLVIASDVLYERRNGTWLLDALERVLAPDGEVLVADPGRTAAAPFLAAAAERYALDRAAHGGPASVTVHVLRLRAP